MVWQSAKKNVIKSEVKFPEKIKKTEKIVEPEKTPTPEVANFNLTTTKLATIPMDQAVKMLDLPFLVRMEEK